MLFQILLEPRTVSLHAQMLRALCDGPCYGTLPPRPVATVPARQRIANGETYLRVEIAPHELVPPLLLVLRRLLLGLQIPNALADLIHVQLLQPRVFLEGRRV